MEFKSVVKLFSNWIEGLRSSPAIKIDSAALTDIGLVRENNEDSFLSLPEYNLWAVADGMGGCESGEVASAIAIKHLKDAIVAGEDLISAIENSHQAINQAVIDGIGAKGMGATIVALRIQGDQYQIAWVGDSRCYLYREHLKQLSKDHSYIQLMLDRGLIKESEIENHPYNNAITQALGGTGETITVDSVTGTVRENDLFLLCSDGLSGEISDDGIEKILFRQDESLLTKAQQLINQALKAGGKDNIALILIAINGKNALPE